MTISGNNNKLIKDWIRPLQKSLTIETENKFINTLGREKYKKNELKNQFQRLIKKETYWRQKEITLNKIC